MTVEEDDSSSLEGTVFRAFVPEEFLEWPAWDRLRRILDANGGSYGISGPRGAGKSWLMLRAIHWATTPETSGGPGGIGLWYPSPSEYKALAFLASLSDSLATEIEHWYRGDAGIQRERRRTRRAAVSWFGLFVLMVFVGALAVGIGSSWGSSHPWVLAGSGLVAVLVGGLVLAGWLRISEASRPEHQLLRQALEVQERARFTATQRDALEVGAEGGRGFIARARTSRERELIQRPATLSSLVNDFRALAKRAGEVTQGRVVIAIDELDKMTDPDGVRDLLRDIKGIFEVPGVRFLVSVSDEAARNLSLGALTERNEFNSSFYTVVQAKRATPDQCAELLDRRGKVPREVAIALAVLAGGNPRELVRLAELVGPVATVREAVMEVLEDEALTLRSDVVTAMEVEDFEPVGREPRVGVFRSLPDEAFNEPEAFDELCKDALDAWEPSWGDAGWKQRFEEPWSRLMIRLAVAGRLVDARSLIRDEDVGKALLGVVVAAGQSSHVARIVLESNLRVETRQDPDGVASSDTLRARFEALARRYEEERGSAGPGADRTQKLDGIVQEARKQARDLGLTADEVNTRLKSERSGDRVVALAAVQATGDPETAGPVLDMASKPRTPFEGFHALRALESLRPGLSPVDRKVLHGMLTNDSWLQSLGKDTARREVASRLLAALEQDASTPA
jgi:hypothetical protein